VHRNGSITYTHQMLGAASIHPDQRAVMPLMPEPIIHRDGTAKNDCERHAAKRFVAKLRQDHPHLKCIVTEDSLSSNAPHIETLHAHGLHDILGVKAGDHPSLFQQGQAAEHTGRVTDYERHDRAAGLGHRFRFLHDIPLNASNAEVRVHFIESWEMSQDKVQHCSWVTDIRVSKRHVYPLRRGGRARWKIENETCKTLKNQGYHFEHNYGHGEQHLSVVFAMLMMLAFLVDQAQQRCCALFQAVWAKLGSKRLVWERLRALFSTSTLASMQQLFEALFDGLQKPTPVFGFDSTSSPAMSSVTAFYSPTRQLDSGLGTGCRRHTPSPFSARPPSIAACQSCFKRRHWIGETLWTLSTGMRLTGLLAYERELLQGDCHMLPALAVTRNDFQRERLEGNQKRTVVTDLVSRA